MKKIVLSMILLTIFSVTLFAQTYECTLYDMRYDDNKKATKFLYNDNIKIYFTKKNNKLEVQTTARKVKANYIGVVNNEDGEKVKTYNNGNIYYAIYSNFKGGVRLLYPHATVDAINCKGI